MLNKKLSILESIFGDYYHVTQKNGNEYLFYCVFCKHHKRKLSFNIEKDTFKCWVCGKAGRSITRIIKQYGNDLQINEWLNLSDNINFSDLKEQSLYHDNNTISLPQEYISLATHKSNPLTLESKLYLKNRGLDFKDIVWWKIGVCLDGFYKDRIIIPSYNSEGNLDYFVARSYKKNMIPYLNPSLTKDIIFNELFIDFNKDLSIVEGIFDCIIAGNAVPLLGSLLKENSIIFKTIVNKCKKIYIALDPDAVNKEKEIIKLFLLYGLDVFKIRVKDYKDVGEMSKKEYNNRKLNAMHINKLNDVKMALEE